jgi:hypothetical protein
VVKIISHSAVANDNPICKKANYINAVFDLLPQLVGLDGFDVILRPVDSQFDPLAVGLTDYLEETSTVVNKYD